MFLWAQNIFLSLFFFHLIFLFLITFKSDSKLKWKIKWPNKQSLHPEPRGGPTVKCLHDTRLYAAASVRQAGRELAAERQCNSQPEWTRTTNNTWKFAGNESENVCFIDVCSVNESDKQKKGTNQNISKLSCFEAES